MDKNIRLYKLNSKKKIYQVKLMEMCNNIFLVERTYPVLLLKIYLICENYNFNTNTYDDGLSVTSLPDAYEFYNEAVQKGLDYVLNKVKK